MNTRFPRNASAKSTEAFLWLGVGDTTRALALLEQAADDHEMWPELDPVDDAMFAPLRESPRFRAVVRRVGLPLSMVDNAQRLRR